ncbi:MAG: BatD family protein [Methanothrix sp.]
MGKKQHLDILRLVCMAFFILLLSTTFIGAIQGADDDDEDEDEVTYNDFTLGIGDRIDISNYRAELIEIQSVKDGIAVLQVSRTGGGLDEQRAFLENRANSFIGGAEKGGITLTVVDILDEESARVRIEYQESLGAPSRRASDRPVSSGDKPALTVQKSFDKSEMRVGDEVKVTVTINNMGSGKANNIKLDDAPPLPEFSYVAGYPPKIKDTLDPGQSDSTMYMMNAIKEGTIRVSAIQVSYTDSKDNVLLNSSEPFDIVINPKSVANLEIRMNPSGPIAIGSTGMVNISIANAGEAPATRSEAKGDITPPTGLEAAGFERSFFEIPPGGEVNYSVMLSGKDPGNYTVHLKTTFDGGDGSAIRDGSTEVVVLKREYKYEYLLLLIPIIIIAAWLYRRHKEYKY